MCNENCMVERKEEMLNLNSPIEESTDPKTHTTEYMHQENEKKKKKKTLRFTCCRSCVLRK